LWTVAREVLPPSELAVAELFCPNPPPRT
jgi:hypothetical protein